MPISLLDAHAFFMAGGANRARSGLIRLKGAAKINMAAERFRGLP
jgi:hypothetical protein